MICNNCKTEYDSHAMTCPNCGAPNNTAKKNKMPVWMHIGAIVSVIVLFSYILCLSSGVLFKGVGLFKDKDNDNHKDYYYSDSGFIEIEGETTTEEQLRLPENIVSEKEDHKDDDDDKKKGDKKKETTTKKHSNGAKPTTTKPSTTKPTTTKPTTTQPTTVPPTTTPPTTVPPTTAPPTTTEKPGIKDQMSEWFK